MDEVPVYMRNEILALMGQGKRSQPLKFAAGDHWELKSRYVISIG